jgi:hypothetical protein
MISKDVTIDIIEISQIFMAPNSCHRIYLHIYEWFFNFEPLFTFSCSKIEEYFKLRN